MDSGSSDWQEEQDQVANPSFSEPLTDLPYNVRVNEGSRRTHLKMDYPTEV
jgi:hypothetical protein